MQTKTYKVTDKAGPWVAGQRKPESGLITLSDPQAAYELLLGTIVEVPQPTKPVPAKPVAK